MKTLVILASLLLLFVATVPPDMFVNKLTVRNRFILDNYEVNAFENVETLSGNTRRVPTSYAVLKHVDAIAGLRTIVLPISIVGSKDTTSIKASGPIFVVPPNLDSFTIATSYAAGDTDAGHCSIEIRKNNAPIDTLSSVDTSGIVTSNTNIMLQTGDVVTFRVFGVSGFLVGLGITLILTP